MFLVTLVSEDNQGEFADDKRKDYGSSQFVHDHLIQMVKKTNPNLRRQTYYVLKMELCHVLSEGMQTQDDKDFLISPIELKRDITEVRVKCYQRLVEQEFAICRKVRPMGNDYVL